MKRATPASHDVEPLTAHGRLPVVWLAGMIVVLNALLASIHLAALRVSNPAAPGTFLRRRFSRRFRQ